MSDADKDWQEYGELDRPAGLHGAFGAPDRGGPERRIAAALAVYAAWDGADRSAARLNAVIEGMVEALRGD